jgi:hypothetical protein
MARRTNEQREAVSIRSRIAAGKLRPEAAVYSIWRKAGFEIDYPDGQNANVMMIESEGDLFIVTVVYPLVDQSLVSASLKQTERFRKRTHTWIVGMEVDDYMMEERTRYPLHVSIFTLDEFLHQVEKLRLARLARLPVKPTAPDLRTRVGKTIVANGPEIKTAITTSIILIEERLEVLNSSRPNAPKSKAKKADEIGRLTVIKSQLETLREYPELLEAGKVTEGVATSAFRLLSQGIGEYWKKHADAICDKMLTFGMFSSLMLVGQLSGVTPEVSFGLSGAMTYGKPVVDALKALKGLFKH